MHTLKLLFALTFSAFLVLSSCKKKEPFIPNPQEIITTVTYTLVPDGGGTSVELIFVDLDGEEGGNAPTITGGTLSANQTYTGSLVLLNESVTPTEDVTEEIQEEDEDHQFFFQSTINDLSVAYTDQDSENNPIGLATTLTTGAEGSGTLTLILKHEPEKLEDGVAGGDPTNAGGETELQIVFPIDVQ